MTAPKLNKRMAVWLALLGTAAWLAFFGNKTPVNSQLPQLASTNLNNKSAGAHPTTVQQKPLIEVQRSNSNNISSKTIASTTEGGRSLEVLVPREQLILNLPTDPGKLPNLFASGDWNPPPLILRPTPPPPPMAPPLPFSFLGKKLEGGIWEVFLSRGEQSYVVHEMTVIESLYRVDAIKPPNLNLTYLPLGQGQSLFIGEPQ